VYVCDVWPEMQRVFFISACGATNMSTSCRFRPPLESFFFSPLKRMYLSILSFETINKLKLFFECGIPMPQDAGTITVGSPKGSVISPLLFLIMSCDLEEWLSEGSAVTTCYAMAPTHEEVGTLCELSFQLKKNLLSTCSVVLA
jgi:hypothetical protein